MPTSKITIKHNKHLVHPCPQDKKLQLLKKLVEKNSNLDIIIVSNKNLEALKEVVGDNILLTDDKGLLESDKATCELMISYDLPVLVKDYMLRLARATKEAIILLDKDEQKDLYPIETVLKRAIRQEVVEGFEYEKKEEKEAYDKPKFDKQKRDNNSSQRKSFDKPRRDDKKSYDKPNYDKSRKDDKKYDKKSYDKPKYDKPKKDGEKSDRFVKKDKKPNKYLGRDENGKAIFSGKTGDRNHRYDGTPRDKPKKTGRKIPIKARKPKPEDKS